MFKLKLRLKVTKIKKRTKSKIFKDLKVGDEVLLYATLCNRAGYQKLLTVENPVTGEKDEKYFTEITKIFDMLEFEEIS